jgi:hypothetical protein
VNICPAENEGLPCPAPAGALIPWKSATEGDLPGDGVDGSLLQGGAHIYYIGGTTGAATRVATTTVSVAKIDAAGLSAWSAGTPLPEARAHAGVAFFAGKAYVIGGASDTTPATTSVYVGTPDATTGLITAWERLDALELPAARSGASVTVVSDGIVVLGGEGTDRSPTTTVWKAKLGANGELEPWVTFMDLPEPRSFAAAAVVGDSIYVWGGKDASGPAAEAVRGDIAVAPAVGGHSAPVVNPDQGDAEIGTIYRWDGGPQEGNLPTPRDGAALWSANGTLYVAGGTIDGTATTSVLWAAPVAATGVTKWTSVELSNLPADAARVGASGVVIGAHVILLGGADAAGAYSAGALSAGTSLKAPVFRVGLFGLTVPGLALQGEVGQQIGFLSAAGAWTLNFVIMLGAAVAYGQRERFRAWVGAKLGRKGASAR